jgi:hypothetical protein
MPVWQDQNRGAMKTETVTTMDYHELEELIIEHFGVSNFSLVAAEEERNDTVWSTVVFKSDGDSLDDYDKNRLLDFRDSDGNNASFITYLLCNILAYAGKLPEGKLLVEICW